MSNASSHWYLLGFGFWQFSSLNCYLRKWKANDFPNFRRGRKQFCWILERHLISLSQFLSDDLFSRAVPVLQRQLIQVRKSRFEDSPEFTGITTHRFVITQIITDKITMKNNTYKTSIRRLFIKLFCCHKWPHQDSPLDGPASMSVLVLQLSMYQYMAVYTRVYL